MTDTEEKSSLSALWKKGKDRLRGRETSASAETQQSGAGESGGTAASQDDAAKGSQSQSRRAQVRSAQIRHRQRKANYQKQLELDASQYRDLIAQAEVESHTLRRENEAIAKALRQAGVDVSKFFPGASFAASVAGSASAPASGGGLTPGDQQLSGGEADGSTPELFSNVDVDELTVSLEMDSIMGTPAFNISSASSGASMHSAVSPVQTNDGWWLSRSQEEAAINFILAIEHCCWDHYSRGDFARHYTPTSATPSAEDPGMGHALMASAYCMSPAPDFVYDARAVVPAAGSQAQPMQWQAPGISLATLRGLANSLNPSDREVTPVQAWFELSERFPPTILLEGGILERLKREFRGVVRCVAYGAAMEREAFESIISRVIREFTPGS